MYKGIGIQLQTPGCTSDIMKSLRILATLIIILSVPVMGHADQANADYKRGVQAEANNKYDEAFQAYSQAHALKPKDARYFTAFTRMRFYAAVEHVRQGQLFRDSGKLQEAVAEFQRAAEIDPTNFAAKGEAHHTEEIIKKQAKGETGPKPRSLLDRKSVV